MFAAAADAWLWKNSISANRRQLPEPINPKRAAEDAAFFYLKIVVSKA
jgi:hypothetical protein